MNACLRIISILCIVVAFVACAYRSNSIERAQRASYDQSSRDAEVLRTCVVNQAAGLFSSEPDPNRAVDAALIACRSQNQGYKAATQRYVAIYWPEVSQAVQDSKVEAIIGNQLTVTRHRVESRFVELREQAEQERIRRDWAKTLVYPGSGGWEFIELGADTGHEYVMFASRRLALRNGSVVSLWTRLEYQDPQSDPIALRKQHLSVVTRYEIDCAKAALKMIAATYYADRNMEGDASSNTLDGSKILWEPIVPGTRGEHWISWACKNIQRSTSEKGREVIPSQ